MSTSKHLPAADRLIVALDVPSVDAALRAVEQLDNVSFFKIGLQLFLTGGFPELLAALRGKRVFVDLKVPGDISNTIAAVVDMCVQHNVAFLTLSESMPSKAIRVAAETRNARGRTEPKFLIVPLVSSLDADDVAESIGSDDLETYVLKRARRALEAGCDGIIASGDAIAWCRAAFPPPTVIVSPGIRPAGSGDDDHKRLTTPADAIKMGADYLVVGRPIMRASDPRSAAGAVINEIEAALALRA